MARKSKSVKAALLEAVTSPNHPPIEEEEREPEIEEADQAEADDQLELDPSTDPDESEDEPEAPELIPTHYAEERFSCVRGDYTFTFNKHQDITDQSMLKYLLEQKQPIKPVKDRCPHCKAPLPDA